MEKTSRRRKYIGKHVKPTDENIMQLLMPSILGMLICMVCLAGATWAWFTATTTVSVPPVSAAYFDVQVTIDGVLQTPEDSEHVYTISNEKNNEIKLTATGTASIGGYCVITVGKDTYYTPWMSIENSSEGVRSISFNLYTDKEEKIKIIPYWGTPSSIDSDHKITNGMQIGTLPQATDGEDFEAPENTGGGTVNIGGGDNATNNDNAGDHNTLQSEQTSSPPANEDKGDSSDNNGGSASDSANTTLSASDNSAGGSHESSSASASGSGSSDSGSGSGGDSDGSSSGGGESSGGSSGGGESSGGGGDNAGE